LKICHVAALVFSGWYLMVPSPYVAFTKTRATCTGVAMDESRRISIGKSCDMSRTTISKGDYRGLPPEELYDARASRPTTATQAMSIRHSAALALMGWYLIVPPYVWPYNQRDLRVPISQWKIVERFDTTTLCEDYLQEMKDDPEAEGLKRMGEMDIGLFAQKVARCIFSDVRTQMKSRPF